MLLEPRGAIQREVFQTHFKRFSHSHWWNFSLYFCHFSVSDLQFDCKNLVVCTVLRYEGGGRKIAYVFLDMSIKIDFAQLKKNWFGIAGGQEKICTSYPSVTFVSCRDQLWMVVSLKKHPVKALDSTSFSLCNFLLTLPYPCP
jgi:hypothetical protein